MQSKSCPIYESLESLFSEEEVLGLMLPDEEVLGFNGKLMLELGGLENGDPLEDLSLGFTFYFVTKFICSYSVGVCVFSLLGNMSLFYTYFYLVCVDIWLFYIFDS